MKTGEALLELLLGWQSGYLSEQQACDAAGLGRWEMRDRLAAAAGRAQARWAAWRRGGPSLMQEVEGAAAGAAEEGWAGGGGEDA